MIERSQSFICLVFLFFRCASAVVDVNQLFTTCTTAYQADINGVQQIIANPFLSTSDYTLQCVVQCVGQSLNVLDSNGRLLITNIPQIPYFNANRAQQAVQQCQSLNAANACATGFAQWQCLVQQASAQIYGQSTNSYQQNVQQQPTYYYTNANPYGSANQYANQYGTQYQYGYQPTNGAPAVLNGNNPVRFPGNYFGRKK